MSNFLWRIGAWWHFCRRLWPHWGAARCWELSGALAHERNLDREMYGSPADAVYEELSCWTE